ISEFRTAPGAHPVKSQRRGTRHMSRKQPTIGYVVSLFPCWSETFILNEILALRERGVPVRIFSLKPPSEPLVHEAARRLLAEVIYPPPPWRLLLSLTGSVVRKPLRWLRLLVAPCDAGALADAIGRP